MKKSHRQALSQISFACLAILGSLTAGASPVTQATATPIKHLIVVIGENHTFDNLFGGFVPAEGQKVFNLLSQGIINRDGTPGPNYQLAVQQQAGNTSVYQTSPLPTGPFAFLPQPQTTYATGLPQGVADARFPSNLPPGPFQITHHVAYDAFLGDPPHRFFQMWQEVDHGKNDLYAWIATTTSIGPDNNTSAPDYGPAHTYAGGEALGFYNMSTGDAAQFRELAHQYALSDNYHQSVMGGTGANFLALVTADVAYFNLNGKPARPFANQIENPDPKPGTNNWFRKDGYTGGTYVNCADLNQPGVLSVMSYIRSGAGEPFRGGNCAKDTYYLVNNYDLGYTFNGKKVALGPNSFTLPPQTIPTIADALSAKKISWKWYSGGREATRTNDEYCGICDPLTGFTSIMTTSLRHNLQGMTEFYADIASADKSAQKFPSVSFVRPFENQAGHPANAKTSDYEKFVVDLIGKVRTNPSLWKETAILVTVDEGGGYYDSGYIQPIDFFGDGPRIPMLAISPWAKHGHVDHSYADHASVLKFIELNWGLRPLSERSRDNLPNPVQTPWGNAYMPQNRPAIADLTNLFNFDQDPELSDD